MPYSVIKPWLIVWNGEDWRLTVGQVITLEDADTDWLIAKLSFDLLDKDGNPHTHTVVVPLSEFEEHTQSL